MNRSVVIVATLDTKGDQVAYLKGRIEEAGQNSCVIDIGVVGSPPFRPDYDHDQVAEAAGTSIEGILALKDRRAGLEKMGEGASNIIRELYARGAVCGLIAMGGSQGTGVSLQVMRGLPLGIPKLMLTTLAYSPAITPDMVGGGDLMMVPWVAGLWGLNTLSRQSLNSAAAAIAGAAGAYGRRVISREKVIGVSSLGGTVSRYLEVLKPALEERGFEAAVFHVLGMPGRVFERAISDGLITASLDLCAGVELLNEITGGVYTAGPHRLEAAGRLGIPQIVSPGAIEAFHWGRDRPFPARYENRLRNWHSALHLTVRSNAEEMAAVGTLMAQKLNRAKGPTALVLPTRGMGALPAFSSNPETVAEIRKGWTGYRRNIKRGLSPHITYIELDATFNDPLYAKTVLELFDDMQRRTGN